MKTMDKMIFDEIISKLKESRKVAIFTHLNPDGDALGSAFAAKSVLEGIGKKAVVYLEKPKPDKFDFLQGEYCIGDDHTVTDADTALAVDCGALNRLGSLDKLYMSIPVKLCIDHHLSNTPFGDIQYTKPDAAATAELIYDMAIKLSDIIPEPAMVGIYTGLSTDTGHFKYSNVTADTLTVAADLLRRGLKHRDITTILYDTVKLEKLKFMGAVAEQIQLHLDGKIAVLKAYDSFLNAFGLTHEDIEELPSIPLSLETVKVSILVKDNNGVGKKVSLRGKDLMDLSEIAGQYGGGGHKNAAAFVTEENIDEVIQKLVMWVSERV